MEQHEHPEAAWRLDGVRVLVVEDEPDTRELVGSILEGIGAQVLMMPGAEEALRAFDGFGPDLVVSDLSLPMVDGWEMIKRLRSMSGGRTVPAMALSANASLEDAARALEAGFDAHLAKPLSRDELVAGVLSVIDVRRT